jgi:hypothetical protein
MHKASACISCAQLDDTCVQANQRRRIDHLLQFLMRCSASVRVFLVASQCRFTSRSSEIFESTGQLICSGFHPHVTVLSVGTLTPVIAAVGTDTVTFS